MRYHVSVNRTAIADAPDNTLIRVEGTIRAVGDTLTSPIDGAPCVFYEVRQGLLDDRPGAQLQRDAQDFLVEDRDQAALVVMERYEVQTRSSQAWQQSLCFLDADINDVSARLSKLKQAMRSSGGANKELVAERRRYRDLATYLCATRAHARNKLHACKTREQQAEYLRSSRQIYEAQRTSDMPELPVMRWVGSLVEGERVVVDGFARWEPDSDPQARASYRHRPLRLTLRAPADGSLIIYAGRADDVVAIPKKQQAATTGDSKHQTKRRWVWIAALAAAAGALLALL